MIKFTFSFENGTFEIIKLKNSYSRLTQSSPPPFCCLWPSCLSSCLPTSWFVFLHTWGIVPKEATVNCFQRQEARVNILRLWRVPYHIAERERTMGTQWKLALAGKVFWNGEECGLGTPASCRDVKNALRGRLYHHKSHLLFTIEEHFFPPQLTWQLTSGTERKKVSV